MIGAGIDVPSSGGAVVSGGATRANITALQNAIIAGGCTLPNSGVDGVWGPETRTGVNCYAQRIGGLQQVYNQFPFVQALMTGSSGGGGGGGVQQEETPPSVEETSWASRFFNPSNPMLWLSIAGVLLVGGGATYVVVRQKRRAGRASLPPTMSAKEFDEDPRVQRRMAAAKRKRALKAAVGDE